MREINLLWFVRFHVPFDWAVSKNHIYALNGRNHLFLREESRRYREMVMLKTIEATRGHRIAHNKVWLDFFVQKTNQKGDAVNVVDSLCDGIKRGLGLDDRWFSIRRVDWEIVKTNPRIYIGIGQESDQDVQACSYCGVIQTLDNFTKKKANKLGVDRICRPCKSAADRNDVLVEVTPA